VEGAQACDFPLTIPDLGSGTMVLAHAHGRRQGSTVGDLHARDGQNPALLQVRVEAAMEDELVVAVKKA
jgi:hypothetical protein